MSSTFPRLGPSWARIAPFACALLLAGGALAPVPADGETPPGARAANAASNPASGVPADAPVLEEHLPALPVVARQDQQPRTPHSPPRRDVLAERHVFVRTAAPTPAPQAPVLGVDVPSDRPLSRWCVAHATATSPA